MNLEEKEFKNVHFEEHENEKEIVPEKKVMVCDETVDTFKDDYEFNA